MTVEQKIAQKAAEVEERKKARMSGIRLEVVEKLALGILDLLDMTTTSTGKEIPVERVNVHYDTPNNTWIQVENKTGIFTALGDDGEVTSKMKELNGIFINEAEDRYLQELLKRHRKVGALGKTAFSEFIRGKGFAVE